MDSEEGQEYWQAAQLAGEYSQTNHRIAHKRIAKAPGEKPITIIENHHNFAWKEKLPGGNKVIIHRKGTTPAGVGDAGIIPGTMASPAFTQSQLKKYLDEQQVELPGGGIDESPFVYKGIHHNRWKKTLFIFTSKSKKLN